MQRLLLIARLVLGIVFLYAAWVKLSSPWPQFAVAINSYGVVPLNWLEPIARTLPVVELILGLLLLSGFGLAWVASAGALMLGFFFSLMVWAYSTGKAIDCGCFGTGEPIGPKTLLRDGGLLALAIGIAVAAFRRKMVRMPAPVEEAEPQSIN